MSQGGVEFDRLYDLHGEPPVSPDTSNYCKARKRLPLSFIVRLVRKIGELLDKKASPEWLWKGRDVHMVDGSTASMPDTPKNQAAYPQSASQKPGLGFPLARFVTIISLATGAVRDLAIGPCKGKRTGETSLLRTLLKRVKARSILLGDRYFASYFGIAELLQGKLMAFFVCTNDARSISVAAVVLESPTIRCFGKNQSGRSGWMKQHTRKYLTKCGCVS